MKILYKTGIAALSMVMLLSCKKNLEINADPNNFTDVPANLLLPGAQVQLAYTLGGDISRVTGNFVQHYAGHRNQPLQYNQYDVDPAASDGLWSSMYSVVLRDLKAVVDKSRESGDSMYVGVSQILMASAYGVLTDMYGDIPFTDALQDDKVLTPKYDKQEDIYPALITMIDAGVSNVKLNTGVKPAGDDLVYGGNMSKWEKFGNALKLRMLNHLSKKQPAAAAAFLNTNPALITSNADNAAVIFGTSSSNANPIYGFDELSGRKDNAVASTIVDRMKQLDDTRIPKFFKGVKTGTLQGQYIGNVPGGDSDDSGENQFSREGSAYASINAPVIFMSAAEVQFLIAEIRLRENKPAEATAAYNAAITADFDFLGVANSDVYIAKTAVAYNNTLQRIIEQKWITLFQAPYEAWTDWRRTSFPALTPAAVNRTNGIIPRRVPYPQLEINLNRSALEAGPGVPVPIESLKQRVWWDM